MKYHVYKDTDTLGKAAALMVATQVLKKKDSVLGFATGSTPVLAYQHMAKLFNEGVVDYADVTTYNLDEYCGLSADHDQSFQYFMMTQLFDHINVPKSSIHIPNGMATDIDAECRAYDASIDAAGGIDLQILGVGTNGHIGFNEPDDSFVFPTHQCTLTQSTIDSNKRFFASADDVPRYALTMGIGTIMKARSIVFMATGENKAKVVRDMIQKDPTPSCPASILQFHPNVTILLDEAAAHLL